MNKLIGDKKFYKTVFVILLPIIIQNTITSFVSLLDNMMVGQVGTLPMSGVSISNQLMNVYYLLTYGTMSSVGIFLAQYKGKEDNEGMQACLRLKFITAFVLFAIGAFVFGKFGTNLILWFLRSENNTPDQVLATLTFGKQYLYIMIIGLLPFVLTQTLSSTLRETGNTFIPMLASSTAVLVNFVFNYILIFGHFGFPTLGTNGAAIATVISRFVEVGIVAIGAYLNRSKLPYLHGLLSKMTIPAQLIERVAIKGSPLILNEFLYSAGMTMIAQCYSMRGIEAVAAINISTTITNLFNIACFAMGNAISILVGQRLGAQDVEGAKLMDYRLLFFDGVVCTIMGAIMFFVAPLFPDIYNTTNEVKLLASNFLRVSAVMLPFISIYLGCYFTMRSGGKTFTTFLFDGGYTFFVSFSLAYVLAHFTQLPVLLIYILVQAADIPKVILGLYLVIKGIWIQNIVN